jgi:hypothetical protein
MHQNYLNKIHLLEISITFLGTLEGSISSIGEFPSQFDLKNMISTNTKDFSWKKMAQICQISENFFSKSPHFDV